jgi:hypothetical protein
MRRTLCLLGVLGLWGCGGENSLGGSVSELFPLEVSRVELLRNSEGFQVSYFNNRGRDIDMVLRLAVSLADVEFEPGDRVRLEGEYAPGHARATVSHLAAGEPLRTLPSVRDGDLHLDRGGKPGEATRGTFSLSFEVTSEYGGGRNVHGSFSGVTGDASFDPPDAGTDAGG